MTPNMRADIDRKAQQAKPWRALNKQEKRDWLDVASTFVGSVIFLLAVIWLAHWSWIHFHG